MNRAGSAEILPRGIRGARRGAASDPGTWAFAQSSPCPRVWERAKEQECLSPLHGCINPTVPRCLLLSLLFGLARLLPAWCGYPHPAPVLLQGWMSCLSL